MNANFQILFRIYASFNFRPLLAHFLFVFFAHLPIPCRMRILFMRIFLYITDDALVIVILMRNSSDPNRLRCVLRRVSGGVTLHICTQHIWYGYANNITACARNHLLSIYDILNIYEENINIGSFDWIREYGWEPALECSLIHSLHAAQQAATACRIAHRTYYVPNKHHSLEFTWVSDA